VTSLRLTSDVTAADPTAEVESASKGSPGGRRIGRTFLLALLLVAGALMVSAAVELVLRYRENVDAVVGLQQEMAQGAAFKIRQFIGDIEKSMRSSALSAEAVATGRLSGSFRFELLKLLKTTPAVSSAAALDRRGQEVAKVSREELVDEDDLRNQSSSIPFVRAHKGQNYFGRLYFVRDSEPYMQIAVPIEWFVDEVEGVLVAEVSLRYMWDVISEITVGRSGYAYVVSHDGDLIAHPDISLVLQRQNINNLPQVRSAIVGEPIPFEMHPGLLGEEVLATHAPVRDLAWSVIVEQPAREAYSPLLASILRTSLFSLIALAMAFLVSLLISRKVVRPLAVLREGAKRIGAGEFGHRIEISSGDEFRDVASEFNHMAARLHESYATLEQRVADRTHELSEALENLKTLHARVQSQAEELAETNRTLEARVAEQVDAVERAGQLRRFLSPQLADAILQQEGSHILESHRREITVVFCDLRGFTGFSQTVEPEDVMQLLADYHAALGGLIHKHEGTLERFLGDGLMVLFNDPVPCPNPAERAVRMAVEMRALVGEVTDGWTKGGYELGFGIGIAQGFATLGRIGFEGRYDYASVGSVSNLASRLCDEAEAKQILLPQRLVPQIEPLAVIEPVGTRAFKGFQNPISVYNVVRLKDGHDPASRVKSSNRGQGQRAIRGALSPDRQRS
jgi:adenylate cyclase